jgi:hypothetical protein
MSLIAFRHGLRASELCDLCWGLPEQGEGSRAALEAGQHAFWGFG